MKKIALMFVAAATVWLAIPAAPASAQTLVIKQGGMHRHHDGMHRDRGYRARAQWRHRDHRVYGKRHHRGPAIVIQR